MVADLIAWIATAPTELVLNETTACEALREYAHRRGRRCHACPCAGSRADSQARRPCGDPIARDANGFVLTGDAAGHRRILDTSVPGVFAVGDVRSGSVKRCATAVGEGAMVVHFVHERMTGVPA
jgi:hypothetical protein